MINHTVTVVFGDAYTYPQNFAVLRNEIANIVWERKLARSCWI